MLSEQIYALRRKQGLSQEQLAEKIGVSRQAVSKWEGGLSTPELDKLKALAECFQVTIDELTGGGAPKPPEEPPGPAAESRLGIGLCVLGAVCLLFFGIVLVVRPSAVHQLNGSSMITLNGSGILLGLSVLCMGIGVILTFKKK